MEQYLGGLSNDTYLLYLMFNILTIQIILGLGIKWKHKYRFTMKFKKTKGGFMYLRFI